MSCATSSSSDIGVESSAPSISSSNSSNPAHRLNVSARSERHTAPPDRSFTALLTRTRALWRGASIGFLRNSWMLDVMHRLNVSARSLRHTAPTAGFLRNSWMLDVMVGSMGRRVERQSGYHRRQRPRR